MKTNQHNHETKEKQQIRGVDRRELVEECLITSNGSATAFVDGMIGDQVLAGEKMPDQLEIKSKLFKNVVRNAVSEYMNQEMVS